MNGLYPVSHPTLETKATAHIQDGFPVAVVLDVDEKFHKIVRNSVEELWLTGLLTRKSLEKHPPIDILQVQTTTVET